jgi:hypothetical protein
MPDLPSARTCRLAGTRRPSDSDHLWRREGLHNFDSRGAPVSKKAET